ncbi:peptidoglycan GlcNAc deacetylase [Streptococcus infantis]|uniref:Peptidoglycan GlcNAc deacetylase n=1 Tax=Streptococcus infantis TaxID=68892 RepID=A0A0F2DZZ9_9STRE|nr:polysaccharide deacetylase family protein [Streptococcus infantis]KJQ75111.1 peptidoglycan GlcNAc deacetylase [Streptococcus infantis]
MTKKRSFQKTVKKENNKKLGILVLLLFFTMLALGSVITYKVLSKQVFEQKIESLKKEKDDAYSQGSQKEHFRKEKSEIITYYPMVGDSVISSVKNEIIKDITDKVEGKDQLIFYYSEKGDSSLTGVENRLIKKQTFDIANSNVVELENTTLNQLYLKENGSVFTLDQLFTDTSKAKEKLFEDLKSTLQDKKVEQSVVDQISADFSAAELTTWKFAYKDSQLVLYPVKATANVEEIAMPISDFFDFIQTSYLTEKDAELYKKVQAEKHKKVVALTFDDGPDGNTTPQALDILAKYKIKATFFVQGKNIAGNESILKRMQSEGHEVGNHSWNHPILTKLSLEDAKQQLTDTEDAITKVLGKSSKLMRPPYGAISDDIRNSLDLSFIMWDVDSLDWKSKNEAAILTEIQRQTTDGSIILMHDIHQTSVNSLPRVIEYLQGQGYSFVTVSELLNIGLKPHGIYYSRN